MSSVSTVKTRSSGFDKYSFIKYMKSIGRAYRKQATELVSICRSFVQAQDQTFNPDADQSLKVALQAVDDALKSASEAGTKTSTEAVDKFIWATEVLHHYETKWHSRDPSCSKSLTVNERMAAAKAKDGTTSSILNTLKEKLRMQPVPAGWSKPTTVVEFLLFKSLPDANPTVVKQVLGEGSNLSEVLWNFSRYKEHEKGRLTLKQNPHFYEGLPRVPQEYGDEFQSDPIENFLNTPKHTVFVLTHREGRVYLESGKDPRAFGNVWCPQRAIIFKDVCGKLEGERIVASSITSKPNLRYCVESPTSADSVDWKPLQDWREPIHHHLLKSPDLDVSIRIGTEQSGPPKSRRVSPSNFNHHASGSSNLMKRDAPSSSAFTQRRPAATAGTPSNHGAALPSSTPTPSPPLAEVKTGIASNHGATQSPPPSSTTTQSRPIITTGIPSNHRTGQFPPLSPQSSPLPYRTTPPPNPLMKRTPPNQHHLTPLNVNQERHFQATNETLNISVTPDMSRPSTPIVAVSATFEITSSYKPHAGSGRTVASPVGPKLEGPTSKAPKPDPTPPPSQPQHNKAAQRPVWKVWFQSVWNGGK